MSASIVSGRVVATWIDAAAVLERIVEVPELALDLPGLDLEVGDGGAELRVPVDQPLVAIEQTLAVELDEHLEHRAPRSPGPW